MSQHLLSAIELLGLAIGLLGFFYLSTNLFGVHRFAYVRPVLSGLAWALLWTIAAEAFAESGMHVPFDTNLGLARISAPVPPEIALEVALGAFVGGYFSGINLQSGSRSKGDKRLLALMMLYAVSLTCIVIIVFGVALILHLVIPDGVIVTGVLFALVSLLAAIDILPRFLEDKDEIVKNIGIIATIVAILAQFLPPVLDLLNIPITKP